MNSFISGKLKSEPDPVQKTAKNKADKQTAAQALEFRVRDYVKTITFLILLLWLVWLTVKVNSLAGKRQPVANVCDVHISAERSDAGASA